MQCNSRQLAQSPKRKFENIFKVRKVHQTLIRDKYSKADFHSIRKEVEIVSQQNEKIPKVHKKNADYHYHFLIISSPQYKELSQKFKALKNQQNRKVMQRQAQVRIKSEELEKYRVENERLVQQRERLENKQQQLRRRIQYLRYRREHMNDGMEQDSEQQDCVVPDSLFDPSQQAYMNLEGLRDMVLSLRYQNGIDINPDQMTYEELLQLEEKMGSVSKGLSAQQMRQLETFEFTNKYSQEMLCSICYQNAQIGDTLTKLPCKHIFHCECVKQWLCKQKICPMCKQEINIPLKVVTQSKIQEVIQVEANNQEQMTIELRQKQDKPSFNSINELDETDLRHGLQENINMQFYDYNFMSQYANGFNQQQLDQQLDCGSYQSPLHESVLVLRSKYWTEESVENEQIQQEYEQA